MPKRHLNALVKATVPIHSDEHEERDYPVN